MSVDLVDSEFSADYFILKEDNQPVCTEQFLHGLQVLATQATSAISNHEAVEKAFERIQKAQWEHLSTESRNIVDQRIQEVRQKWVKVCFGEHFRHVAREHLRKNCGPKFHAQYTSVMKDATEPKLNLLPPDGVSVDFYDEAIVKAFLDYFQTGTLSENALNTSILELLSLAHQHQIEGLITKCTDLLKEQLDDHENLDTLWEFANQQNIPQLTFACLSYIQANPEKISKELTGKYEKALPVVKALFTNEIILNQSPSGNREVRIEVFNEETASQIEQLSKLFSIRSLVISEVRTEKRLNNCEKLFPFLNEISPKLMDLQELIFWNETPKDQDFQSLKDHFPNLIALGNDAPFLKTFEQVKTYLNIFRNPDEDNSKSEKLVLRSLNLSSLSSLEDVQMEEITPHLQELYHIYIKSDKITLVSVPIATVIDCRGCKALTTIDAPKATEIYCSNCTALTTLQAPNATKINCQYCTALTTINAPKAIKIYCYNCTALKSLKAPKATEFHCYDCISLTTIKAPDAAEVYCSGCTALTTLKAPDAAEIYCSGCTALTTLKAPNTIKINCQYCTALITIDAYKATEIYCSDCTALTTIDAPKATEIYCSDCTALTTLQAPNANKFNCQYCTTLTTINAPVAAEICCSDCTVLKNLKAPKATKIYCYNCTALTTLKAPNATKINCKNCTALTTIDAPKATEIYCRGCTELITLNAPKATKIT